MQVKRDAHRLGLLLLQQFRENIQKAKNGVGIQAVAGFEHGAHAVVGAVYNAVSVKHHQFHGKPPVIKYN